MVAVEIFQVDGEERLCWNLLVFMRDDLGFDWEGVVGEDVRTRVFVYYSTKTILL